MKGFLARLVLVVVITTNIAAQSTAEPSLTSAGLPTYPPLAAQGHIQGTVKISFVLDSNGNPTDVRAISGHPMLKPFAVASVKTWKFEPPKNLSESRQYETEFVYRLSGNEVDRLPSLTVSLKSFQHIEIVTDVVRSTVSY
jgi:TonB family protein